MKNVIVKITYKLRDGTSGEIELSEDFSDAVLRQRFVVRLLRLFKGGYVSFIELSKLIAQSSKGCLILNPISISKFETLCTINEHENKNISDLLELAELYDCGKIK